MHKQSKRVPRFWWDFDSQGDIIVQGDKEGGERLACFPVKKLDATEQIQEAEKLISDYSAGRKTPNWRRM